MFRIKYATTSASIISDAEVAAKIEQWIPRAQLNEDLNHFFDQQIERYRSRKRNYWDEEQKAWRDNDGSLETRKKIFLSQFSPFPEFVAKRRILHTLNTRAENEVRIEKGFKVVVSLMIESLLYSQLKQQDARTQYFDYSNNYCHGCGIFLLASHLQTWYCKIDFRNSGVVYPSHN